MTRRALLSFAEDQLTAVGIENAQREAAWICEEVLQTSRLQILIDPEHEVHASQVDRVKALVERRMAGEPVQYLIGHADFFGLRLRVTPAVLIPRPETEQVTEAALKRLRGREAPWVLDVGTGSGAIALAVKHERPDAEVFACDISPEALAVASGNAHRLGLYITFVEADALPGSFATRVPPWFDLIVSNPPYVPESEREILQQEVREHEPEQALLTGTADPLVFYRALAGHAERVLKPAGHLVVETHADYGEAVRGLFASTDLSNVVLERDLAGHPRIVSARAPATATPSFGTD